MAKREFIDKNELLKLSLDDAKHPSIYVKYSRTYTEEDIVKPYLDKLKADINEMDLNRIATEYEDKFYGFQNEILQIIDSLLSDEED